MNEVPQGDLFEVDDPTQPFSRTRIDELRRAAEQRLAAVAAEAAAKTEACADLDRTLENLDLAAGDGEWFEVDGHRIRVSLEAFDDICLGRKPDNLVSSADSSLVFGEIGWDPLLESDGAMEWSIEHRRSRRKWVLVFLVAPIVVALAVWAGLHGRPADQPTANSAIEFPQRPTRVESVPVRPTGESMDARPQEPPVTPPLADDQPPAAEPIPDDELQPASREDEPRSEDGCSQRRKQASDALRHGQWTQLDKLAQRTGCWPRTDRALALRMRALFELERFQECVKLGARSKSREIQQWVNNCQRARG